MTYGIPSFAAALGGHSDQVDLSYHSGLSEPAVSRYGATTPKLLGWFKLHNSGREYGDQVKPHNFLIAFQGRQDLTETDGEPWTPKRGRPRKPSPDPTGRTLQSKYQRSRRDGLRSRN